MQCARPRPWGGVLSKKVPETGWRHRYARIIPSVRILLLTSDAANRTLARAQGLQVSPAALPPLLAVLHAKRPCSQVMSVADYVSTRADAAVLLDVVAACAQV